MRSNQFIIHTGKDAILIPLPGYDDHYVLVPLIYTGGHYVMPIDRFDQKRDGDTLRVDLEEQESSPDGTSLVKFVDYPLSKEEKQLVRNRSQGADKILAAQKLEEETAQASPEEEVPKVKID